MCYADDYFFNLKAEYIMYKIIGAVSSDNRRIEDFLSVNHDATFYHLPKWLEILAKESSQKAIKLICINELGNIVGYMPLLFTKGMPFGLGGILAARRLASLPRSPIAGPIAENPEVLKLLIDSAIDLTKSKSKIVLQLKYECGNLDKIDDKLVCVPWRKAYYKEIPSQGIKISLASHSVEKEVQRAINKAKENNISIREAETIDDLHNWYHLYLETMRFHTTPARRFGFFKDLWDEFHSAGLMSISLVEMKVNSKAILLNGAISFRYKERIYGAFKGSSRKYFKFRVNDLLHWYELNKAQEEGFKIFDMGEVQGEHDGLDHYKKKWGMAESEIFHYYLKSDYKPKEKLDPGNNSSLAAIIWRHLPLPLIEYSGSITNRLL